MSAMTKADAAVELALKWASDPSHGYDQISRWGPDYDCSSFLISVWEAVGVPVKSRGATYTGNMRSVFMACGFKEVPVSAGLRAGDVLLNEMQHTAMYIGNGQIVHAGGNEYGKATGGRTGDQTGREIGVTSYYVPVYGWDCALRYEETEPASPSDQAKEAAKTGERDGCYTVQAGDTLWGIAERFLGDGTRWHDLYMINDLRSTDIYAGQVLRLRSEVSDSSGEKNEQPKAPAEEDEITKLARAVIRGEYGNGLERALKLGTKYKEVQLRVNELLRE